LRPRPQAELPKQYATRKTQKKGYLDYDYVTHIFTATRISTPRIGYLWSPKIRVANRPQAGSPLPALVARLIRNQPVFKGCLGGTKDNYTLKDQSTGQEYRLHSDKDISEHVGNMVEIRGTIKKEGQDPWGNLTAKVWSHTCQVGEGMWYTREAIHTVVRTVCLAGLCLIGISAVAQGSTELGQNTGNGEAKITGKRPVEDKNESKKQADTTPVEARSVTARAWEVLDEGMAEKDISKRTEAIAALGIVGSRKAMSLLEAALRDDDAAVRQTAVVALGQIKSRRSVRRLKQLLNDEQPEVSFAAAQALWRMGDRSGRSILFEVLAGERTPSEGGLGRKVAGIKGKLHNPGELAHIGIKQGARVLLGPFAIGITVAEELLKDQSAAARALAAALLGDDRRRESAEELEKALDDKSWLVRSTAAKSLAKRRHRHALPRLEALLNDDKYVVRYSAAGAVLALS
jgi:HEAT repeats